MELTAKTKDGQTVEFDLKQFAYDPFKGKHLVDDPVLGIVEIDPDTVRCHSEQQVALAREVLGLLKAINAWFSENPEAAPYEPPWAKDFYALMEKLDTKE